MPQQTPFPMSQYILVIIGIMLLSGIVGGIANYFILKSRKDKINCKDMAQYIVLGIIAAFAVPLFLNTMSSNLLERGQSSPLNLFVFAGFCLILALYSRSFLENMYNRIMQQVKKVENEVDEMKGFNSEPDHEPTSRQVSQIQKKYNELSEDEQKVLEAFRMREYPLRSLSGLVKDTNLPRETVSEILEALVMKGLIAQTIFKENQVRWYLTTQGKEILKVKGGSVAQD